MRIGRGPSKVKPTSHIYQKVALARKVHLLPLTLDDRDENLPAYCAAHPVTASDISNISWSVQFQEESSPL